MHVPKPNIYIYIYIILILGLFSPNLPVIDEGQEFLKRNQRKLNSLLFKRE